MSKRLQVTAFTFTHAHTDAHASSPTPTHTCAGVWDDNVQTESSSTGGLAPELITQAREPAVWQATLSCAIMMATVHFVTSAFAQTQAHVHLERLQQTPVSSVLQLVLLSRLAQTQRGLALSVQLIVEVVQQRGSRSPLQSIHTHTHTRGASLVWRLWIE